MILQRAQKRNVESVYDFNIFNGQHGEGIYAFIACDKLMMDYYTRMGEDVYTFSIDDYLVMDLSGRDYDYWDARGIMMQHSHKGAFIFKHSGPGIPTSVEVLITDPEIIELQL